MFVFLFPRRRAAAIPAADAAPLKYVGGESRRLLAASHLTLLTIYLALASTRFAPAMLPLALAITFVGNIRYIGYIHALQHACRSDAQVSLALELMPAFQSPFIPSFSGTRRIHLLHHKFETEAHDPDNFMLESEKPMNAFLRCMFTIEHWFLYSLRTTTVGWAFLCGLTVRVALLATLWMLTNGFTVLALLVATKLAVGVAFYFVSFVAHVHDGRRGNYVWFAAPQLARVSRWLFGPNAYNAASLHGFHHAHPWIACAKLGDAFRAFGAGIRDDRPAAPSS
jgi:hypothetical protein